MSIHQSFFIDKTLAYLGSGGNAQTTVIGTSINVTSPSGLLPGDLMIAVISTANTPGAGGFTQASFTSLGFSNGGAGLGILYRQVISSTESSTSYTFSFANSRTAAGVIFAYRNASIDTIGTFATSAGGNLTVTGITPSKSDSILFAVGAVNAGGEVLAPPSGTTTLIDGWSAEATAPDFGIFIRASRAVASGNQIIQFSGAGNNSGVHFSIVPR